MNPIFVKKYLPFKEQDSKITVLFFFFLLLPITALFPHAHTLSAFWTVAFFAVEATLPHDSRPLYTADARLYVVFLTLCLSGILLPQARGATILSVLLRLSFFLPRLFFERKRELRRILSLVGGVLGILALLEIFLDGGVTGYNDPSLFSALSRARGIFGNPNITAAFLLSPASFALYDLLFEKKSRLFSLFCFFGSLAGIAATYSRGALLALLFSSFLLLSWRFGAFRVLLTVISLLPLLSLFAPSTLISRLSSVLSPDTSVRYRFSLWKSVFRLPPRALIFGVGEGKKAMLTALSPVLAAGLLQVEHTHSIYLHLLLSHGIIGLLLFLFLCARAILFGKDRGARAALLALLLFGIFDDPLYFGQTEVLFWLTLGLT